MATHQFSTLRRLDLNNFISLILILGLIVPLIISLIYIQYQKKQVKRAIKKSIIAGLDKKDLVYFEFSFQEKQKLRFEHAKEFEYQGQMYDIVFEEVRNDTVYYWCWHDHQETELNQKLYQLLSLALEHSQDNDVFKIFKKLFYTEPIVILASVEQEFQSILWKPINYFNQFFSQSFIPPEIVG